MQSSSSSSIPGFIFLFMFLCGIALYVFYCYCLKRIVEKCGEEPGAIIWIPIVQFLPLFRVAKLNPWLILLMLVPVANLVVTVLMWLGVLKVLGRDPLMVIVAVLFAFVYIPYLALSSVTRPAQVAA